MDSRNARQRSSCSGARLDGRRWVSLTRSAYGEEASPQMQTSSASIVDKVRSGCCAIDGFMEVMVWDVMRCCRIGCVAFYALLFINFLTLNLMYSSISRSLFGNTAVASLLVLCSLFMAACDKEYSPDVDGGNPSVPLYASISIRVADVDGPSFDADAQTDVRQGGPTRVLRPLGELCGRISYALYTEASDGTGFDKVVESEQKSDDESFGQMTLTAPKGKYRLVVIAHSGLKKATLTNPEKITFDG